MLKLTKGTGPGLQVCILSFLKRRIVPAVFFIYFILIFRSSFTWHKHLIPQQLMQRKGALQQLILTTKSCKIIKLTTIFLKILLLNNKPAKEFDKMKNIPAKIWSFLKFLQFYKFKFLKKNKSGFFKLIILNLTCISSINNYNQFCK